jgi:hypothetical protein
MRRAGRHSGEGLEWQLTPQAMGTTADMPGASAPETGDVDDLETWLRPQSFPADGDMLADETRARGGPHRLVAALRRLPIGRVYQCAAQTARDLRAGHCVGVATTGGRLAPPRG